MQRKRKPVRYLIVPFKNIGIGSFFYDNSKICVKYDEETYLKMDPLREKIDTIECLPNKSFNVLNVTWSYIRDKKPIDEELLNIEGD